MSRLIDADVAYELFSPFSSAFTDPEVMSAYLQTLQLISNATGTDAVNVVRCKDCKHYDKFPTWSACTYWSGDPYEQASVNDDDFCSYGEREGE